MTTVEPNRLKAANCCAEVFATPFLQVLCEPSRASILRALVLKGRSDITTLAADLDSGKVPALNRAIQREAALCRS